MLVRPGADRLGKNFDVTIHRPLEAFDGRVMGLGDIAVKGRLDLFGSGWMSAIALSVAIDLHELTDALQIARKRHDHDVIVGRPAETKDSGDITAAVQIGGCGF